MKIIREKELGLFTCPCCGFKTLKEKPPGTFEICRVCGWEDDNLQFADPDYSAGANNGLSLREWQKGFYEVKAEAKLLFKNLARKSENKWYDFDEDWKPLDE